MAIIAILTGGLLGSLTALVALFGVGVDWSTGLAIYFATATLFAMPILGVGMFSQTKVPVGPKISDWENEFHGAQPQGPLIANTFDEKSEKPQDRSAA